MLRSRERDERDLKGIVPCRGLTHLCGRGGTEGMDLMDVTGLHSRERRRLGSAAELAWDREIGRTAVDHEAIACPTSQHTRNYPIPYTSS